MKNAPTDQGHGALGEQLTFLSPPPFCPSWPNRNSLADRTNDDGPTVAAVAHQESKQDESFDFDCDGIAWQAALTIEGEDYARAYLDRLRAGISEPGELAVVLSFLAGEMLQGACRVIEKALGRLQHG